MNDKEMVAAVNKRIDAANRKPKGADHEAITRKVAKEGGVTYEHLRKMMIDAWAPGVSG